jgi:hypothetical protein
MKSNTGRFITIAAICLGLMISLNVTLADAQSLQDLSAEWWRWALSIPTPVNPESDGTGEDCMVGQRGATWFLAGVAGGGSATRTCSIPQGTMLFFPVIDAVNFNSPNVCGQNGKNIPVATLRAQIAPFIDGASKLSVKVNGKEVTNLLQRVQSSVFAVALPEDNGFDEPCARFGGVPAGIYSPAVADGFYVDLPPLMLGKHTLSFHAENTSAGFVEDVTYNLTVVPVLLQ